MIRNRAPAKRPRRVGRETPASGSAGVEVVAPVAIVGVEVGVEVGVSAPPVPESTVGVGVGDLAPEHAAKTNPTVATDTIVVLMATASQPLSPSEFCKRRPTFWKLNWLHENAYLPSFIRAPRIFNSTQKGGSFPALPRSCTLNS